MAVTFVRNVDDAHRPLHRDDRPEASRTVPALPYARSRNGKTRCCAHATPSQRSEVRVMLEQYKKTFLRMQVLIAVVTIGVLAWTHVWPLAALFFATMQLGAVSGAMWGVRLKEKVRHGSMLSAR